MVEVDVQLLVGAAVTVFLALMFFGVVVLWDVALALRSVGDKIDKLEDNIDDDLMDIGHALDGISSAPGGGGTQLHLSGGTISSGPEPQAQTQAQGQPTQSPRGAQTQTQPQTGGVDSQPHQHQQQAAHQSPQADGAVAEQSPETTAAQADDTDADATEPAVDAGADADESEPEPTPTEDEPDPEPVHPRAKRSRGRFVAPPDRTPWYATALDHEAIREARSPIAGALTDGSVDESEIIAVGPSDPVETDGAVESADDAVVGDAPATDAPSADEAGEVDLESDDEPVDEPSTAETGADVLAFDEDGAGDGDENESDDEDEAEANDGDEPGTDDADVDAGSETEEDADGERTTSDERSQAPETGLEPITETDLEVSEDADATDALETVDEDETTVEPADDETADESAVDPTEDESAADGAFDSAGVDQSPFGDVAAFDFETDLEDEDDVTVEEAVDTINEEAPAPELSSHKFDVTAEVHRGDEDEAGDGAVLVFEFDTDTVDISGSTKRLLQYQMRSFADRESTPEGDVTIGRDRIVIEIADTDGNAVKRWGEAAVSIIDRTLYLSDNSSEEN